MKQSVIRLVGYSVLSGMFYLVSACSGSGGGGSSNENIPPNNPSEGSGAGVIFSDDFESEQPLGERYFEYESAGESFVRVPGVGLNGSFAMRAAWQPGQVNAGNIKLAFGRVPAGLGYPSQISPEQDFREIYWRLYLRNEEGWSGYPDKLSRLISFGSESSWAEAVAAHVWSSQSEPVLMLDPASGIGGNQLVTSEYNDAGNMRWLGMMPGQTPIFAAENAGRWYCIEAHVKLNSPGGSDGVFELWIDNNLEAGSSSLDWVQSWQDYGLNSLFIENYWNAGAPAERVRYIDNLVVSTERIGCL